MAGRLAGPSGRGWHRARSLGESFRFAWEGFKAALHTQRNLRIDLAAAVLALAGAWMLELPASQVALVILASAAVVAAELFNSALEAVVDLVQLREDPLARRAKDIAAAAVLATAVGALLVGALLFLPALWRLWGS